MENKEFEKWVSKRALYSTVESFYKNHKDEIILSEYALECLIEDAREEGRTDLQGELSKKYYFGYCRGICNDCKAHDDYLMYAEESTRNRGFGSLPECKHCDKQHFLAKPESELLPEDFEEEIKVEVKGA